MTTIREVQNPVAAILGVSRNDLLSPRRLRRLARPRQAATYLAKLVTARSTVVIAREFRRDHTTVMHANGLVPMLGTPVVVLDEAWSRGQLDPGYPFYVKTEMEAYVLAKLKRDRTLREIIAQVLDYASWVQSLTAPQIYERAQNYLGRGLASVFSERFGASPPERLNQSHSMVIVASALDPSSQRIVRYLSETHGVAINTAFFTVFEEAGQTLLTTDWLLDQQEVAVRSEAKVQAPWQGLWYVNAGEGEHRSWEDMRRYGFVAAGGGEKWSGPLGQRVFDKC